MRSEDYSQGAYFPETMWSFGTWIGTNYGCPDLRASKGYLMHSRVVENTYLRHYRTQGLELSALMLEAAMHAPSTFGVGSAFAVRTMLPIIVEVLRFFFEHYELTLAGEMVMRAQALETWQECVNPTTDVAGLHWVINKTIDLASSVLAADDLQMITSLKAQLVRSMDRTPIPHSGSAQLSHLLVRDRSCQWTK
jgi:hypothetical protein